MTSAAPATSGGPGRRHPNTTCNLPPERGSCKALFHRFHYDPALGRCVQFVYGGCGGNANRFDSIDACMAACP